MGSLRGEVASACLRGNPSAGRGQNKSVLLGCASWPHQFHVAEFPGNGVGPASIATHGRGETPRIGGVNAELPPFLRIQEMGEHDEGLTHVPEK